jgi:hypothetical protein
MVDIRPTTYARRPLLWGRIIHLGIGAIAAVLVMNGQLPALTAAISIIYGLIAPAWLLRRWLVPHLPELNKPSAALWLIPVLLLFWVVILTLLWTPAHTLNEAQAHMTIIVAVVSVAILLAVNAPFGPLELRDALYLRGALARGKTSICLITLGSLIAIVISRFF